MSTKADASHVIITDYGTLHQALVVGFLNYQLRMSNRAKRARITVKPNRQIEVVLPLGVPRREADVLVRQQQAWLERALRRIPLIPQEQLMPEWIELQAIDERIRVEYMDKQRKPWVWQRRARLISLCCEQQAVAEHLRAWLKGYARVHLPGMLEGVAEHMGVDYRAVSVRLQKTRWGSCSVHGNISLNAKLLLLPVDIVRYILVHELAHIRHMNHSAAFWQYVAEFEPDYQQKRRALRQMSMSLPAWLYA